MNEELEDKLSSNPVRLTTIINDLAEIWKSREPVGASLGLQLIS